MELSPFDKAETEPVKLARHGPEVRVDVPIIPEEDDD